MRRVQPIGLSLMRGCECFFFWREGGDRRRLIFDGDRLGLSDYLRGKLVEKLKEEERKG